jgi:Family of unknown function (DUF6353)
MNISGALIKATKQSQFFLNRNAPTILTGVGVAGFIATTVVTIRATSKAVDLIPEIGRKVKIAKALSEDMTEKEKTEELIKVYASSSLKLLQVYGPTLILGSASVVAVLAAHGMMRKRQASLVAAYAALDAGYKSYRRRVSDLIGEEDERLLYHGLKKVGDDAVEVCEIFDDEDVRPQSSPYSRFFDETSRNWTKTPEYNLMFLRSQQDWANDRLRAHGFVFLNEVYESLGLERSQAGQMVGWKLGGDGDGFVDFGIYDIADECNRAFVNGLEHTVLLDFNVDGIIKI